MSKTLTTKLKKLWKTIIRKEKEKNVLSASSPPVVCAYPNNINTCNGNVNEDEINVTAEEVNYNKDDDDDEMMKRKKMMTTAIMTIMNLKRIRWL